MKRTLSAAMSLLLAAVSASAQVPASALTKIGTAAAVAGAVRAVSEGAVGRVVSSGKPLFLNDHVTTDAAGRLQVLLLDETIFTLGPNSDMVLDDFVYDPKTSAGKITATIAKGAFRFVTGKVAQRDPSKLKIKVAVGTIGVRGSIGVGETGPGGTIVINGGARNPDNHDDSAGIYAESGGKIVNLPQPGVGTRISPDGRISGASFLGGDLNRIMGELQTRLGTSAGGKGGAGGGPPVRGSVTERSGRSTAIGGALASESAAALGLSGVANTVLTQAVQNEVSGFASGISTWDQIRTITTGIGTYTGTGSYSCSGGLCGAGGSGAISLTAQLNFATMDLVGGSNQMQFTTGPESGQGGASTGFFVPTAYNSLTGNAVLTATSPGVVISPGNGSTNWNNSTITFQNAGGIAAKNVLANIHYSDTLGSTTTGSVTGGR